MNKTPPDLAELFSLIDGAKKAVLFLAFLPSRGGLFSIIEQARKAGETDPDLLVLGAISDPTAMPGYQAKARDDGEEDDETPAEEAARKPYVYDQRHTHIVRAANLGAGTAMGDFEAEILKLGTAVVHDKIVVIDPLSEKPVVAIGSHNLGYKASYENDREPGHYPQQQGAGPSLRRPHTGRLRSLSLPGLASKEQARGQARLYRAYQRR